MDKSNYYGRRVLVNWVDQQQQADPAIKVLPTIAVHAQTIRCYRCNTETPKRLAALPNGEYYCPHCINLGRVSTLDKFYHVLEPNQFTVKKPVLSWHGQLSPLQERAAKQVASRMKDHQRQLLWAVTGAGKTEMMFKGLAACLARRERIAIASPRVDVCLELYPRLQAAFANTDMAILHAHQELPYHYAQLTICTTHQLLRFYHAFDNLIIDEVDAFPFTASPALFFASRQAVKKNGGILYLTATPSTGMIKQVRRQQLAVTYLPLRYHGALLPIIHRYLAPRWRHQVKKGTLPASLLRRMRLAVANKHRFLLFVSHVDDLAPVAAACRRSLTGLKFTTVHASDPHRLSKVQGMRDHLYTFLITTSILERGVTFPEIDVLVLGADDEIFSTAALVQIAGRAGRSVKRPTGHVGFWVSAHRKNVQQAVRQINSMNRKGRDCQSEVSHL